MPAAVLGDRAAGKTTFIGLLYNAQLSYSNKPENRDKFRFFADPKGLKMASDVYTELKTMSWPDSTARGQKGIFKFLFGFEKLGGVLPPWVKMKIFKQPFNIVNFSVYDVAGEDVTEMTSTPDGQLAENMSDIAKALLESRILVILIDASKITDNIYSKDYRKLLKYDSVMAILISMIAEYNAEKSTPVERKIYPVMVLTKFDTLFEEHKTAMVTKMQILKKLDDFDIIQDENIRRKYFNAILCDFFPQTLAMLKGAKLKDISFDDIYYFHSYVRTTFDVGVKKTGKAVPKLKPTGKGGHEVDFSYNEYERFINHFKHIAREMPDDVKEKEEIATKKQP